MNGSIDRALFERFTAMGKYANNAPPSLAGQEWLADANLAAVIDAIEAVGGTARIAGGAVRNGLLGEPVKDVDLATDMRPEAVRAALEAAQIKTVDTGIAHGTVTAVVRHKGKAATFEVTTLRVDVETFGRHASVAFTDDWSADASRRDFTINAIYCNRDGTLFDPLSGMEDIKARRVRFVGSAGDRIEEDYLRILRFFRIHAEYGEGAFDGPGLAACRAHLAGLEKLSAERIRQEMLKLLGARRAIEVVHEMEREGLLSGIVGTTPDVQRFERLCGLELGASLTPQPLLRLAALLMKSETDVADLKRRYVLTNAESKRLLFLASQRAPVRPEMTPSEVRCILYRIGREAFLDAVLFDLSVVPKAEAVSVLAVANGWEVPEFPLSGEDVMAAGMARGPEVGRLLRRLEERWIASDFALSPGELKDELKKSISSGNTS